MLHAAKEANVRRYLQQSSGFFLKASGGLANEDCPFAVDASPNVAISARTYDELERRLVASPEIEAVVLRYGFFYGPGTWYHPEGAAAEIVRQQQRPIIGAGNGVWSWVHLDDAVDATVSALTCPPGKYNVVDDDPVEVRVWLPAFARFVNAPPPATITEAVALELAGEDAVYYATRLSGASNRKAKEVLNFVPRRLEWLGKL